MANTADDTPLISTFPWRPVRDIHLWIDGQRFYPRMLQAISKATVCIDLEMYLVSSGNISRLFADALCEAAQRGVNVRMLIDDIGARDFLPADRQRLERAGVQLRVYNPLRRHKFTLNLSRDHRKILAVDGRVAFVGGAGLTDDFDSNERGRDTWHDLMIETSGDVVHDWHALFAQGWEHYLAPPYRSVSGRVSDYLRSHSWWHLPGGVDAQTRVNGSNGQGNEQIKGDLVKRIRRARHCVWLATAYFYPSRKLRKALCEAARRGVDVRLLLPGPRTDHPSVRYASRRYFENLLQAGVVIHEYQPGFLHMKVALVDQWVTLGSCNFDRWNLRWNLEANQEIMDAEFAREVRRMFEVDFQSCQTFTIHDWVKRHWQEKLREHFWFRIAQIFEYITTRIRINRNNGGTD